MERRSYHRYEVSAVVNFEWELADGTRRQATGISRDLSAGGLFVFTDDPPPFGTTVEFDLDFGTARPGTGVNVRAKGEVCRIEATSLPTQRAGFAVSSGRMRLERAEPSSE